MKCVGHHLGGEGDAMATMVVGGYSLCEVCAVRALDLKMEHGISTPQLLTWFRLHGRRL